MSRFRLTKKLLKNTTMKVIFYIILFFILTSDVMINKLLFTNYCITPPIEYHKQNISISFEDNFKKFISPEMEYIILTDTSSINEFVKAYYHWNKIKYSLDYHYNPIYRIEKIYNTKIICDNQYDINKFLIN